MGRLSLTANTRSARLLEFMMVNLLWRKGLLGGDGSRSTEPRIIAEVSVRLEAVGGAGQAGNLAGEQGRVAGEQLHQVDAAALVRSQVTRYQLDQRAHGWRQAVLRVEVAQQVDDLPVSLFECDVRIGGQMGGDLHTPVVQVTQVAVLVQGDGAVIGQDQVAHLAHDQLTLRVQRQASSTKPA